jgi:hypothetical protein
MQRRPIPRWLERWLRIPSQAEIQDRLTLAYAMGRLDMAREIAERVQVPPQVTQETAATIH